MSIESQPRATLDLFDPDSGPRSIGLEKSTFRLGRHRDNDLKMPDNFVSRHHAEIRYDGTNYVFRDLGSSCGSFINGRKTDEKVLRNGDTIRLGRKDAREIAFRCEGARVGGEDSGAFEAQRVMTVIDESQTRFLNTSLLKQFSTGSHTAPTTFKRLSALYEVSSAMLSLKSF